MTEFPHGSDGRYPTRKSLREARLQAEQRMASAHGAPEPTLSHTSTVEATGLTAKARRTTRQRIASVFALACATGLAVSFSMPFFTALSDTFETEAEAAAATQQGLFSEISVEELPVSLEDIEYVATDSSTNVSYSYIPDVVVNFPFREPVRLTDGFGYRSYPVAQFHDAQDFAAPAGTPISAIADGIVLESGFASDGCGYGVKLEHEIGPHTVTSRYCHMLDDSTGLSVGDEVKMGDLVGPVGSTGLSFGPHLHLAIRVDDEPVDPIPFLLEWSQVEREADEADNPEQAETSETSKKATER